MDRETPVMLQRLIQQWSEVTGSLERMSPGASVLPNDGWEVIHPIAASFGDLVRFELKPVVFNLPERANHRSAELYVVTEGWLELRRDAFANRRQLVTHAFATRAAYFRRTSQNLEHVYGAHHDVTIDELGHPTFHTQMRGFPERGTLVASVYKMGSPIMIDRVSGVLQNVRLPTAQMDFFSVSLQVLADHLLINNSGEGEKAAFNSLLKKSEFLLGAAARSPRLTTAVAQSCYRALHWYPIV